MVFDFGLVPDEIDLCITSTRNRFDLASSAQELAEADILPGDGESVRLISPAGGWSSCSLLMALAERCNIRNARITTLRVGKKELDALVALEIPDVEFCLCDIQRQNKAGYDYASYFEEVCRAQGYTWRYARNHSKVILLDTDAGKLTIETSSNFNENPKIEQFCITNDTAVYGYYLGGFQRLGIFEITPKEMER